MSISRKLAASLRSRRREMLDFVRALIALPTENPPGNSYPEMCPRLLETRLYARKGIPALAYGPGLLGVSHGPREFVPVRNIEKCALVYALTAARLLGAS